MEDALGELGAETETTTLVTLAAPNGYGSTPSAGIEKPPHPPSHPAQRSIGRVDRMIAFDANHGIQYFDGSLNRWHVNRIEVSGFLDLPTFESIVSA